MTTIVTADQMIDGTGGAPIRGGLVVEDGKIREVFSGAAPGREGATELAFPGCTILPGLVDAHVHLNLPGDGSTLETAVRETDGVLVATSTLAAVRALQAGITTVRDLGAARRTVFDARRAFELGHGHGARIIAAGQPITITGGHCWYMGGEADGEDGVRRKVREMAKLGADYIKVMASGGGTLNTQSWRPSFTRAELAAMADEAHRLERTITAHCLCAEASDWAAEAGYDGIEHAQFLADRAGNQVFVPGTADKIARAGVVCTSTLAVGGFMIPALRAIEQPTPAERAALDRWLRMHEANLRHFGLMRDAGVTWVAGTDAGWRYTAFDGLPLELELMRQGGMTALEAIHAGTGRAAHVCGIADRVGTLAPGKIADVLVVQGDPLDDLARLGHVRLVLQGGETRVAPPA